MRQRKVSEGEGDLRAITDGVGDETHLCSAPILVRHPSAARSHTPCPILVRHPSAARSHTPCPSGPSQFKQWHVLLASIQAVTRVTRAVALCNKRVSPEQCGSVRWGAINGCRLSNAGVNKAEQAHTCNSITHAMSIRTISIQAVARSVGLHSSSDTCCPSQFKQ